MLGKNNNSLDLLVKKVAYHLGVRDIVEGSSPYDSVNNLAKDVRVWVDSTRQRNIRQFSFYFTLDTTTFTQSITEPVLSKALLGNLFDGKYRYAYLLPKDFLSVANLYRGDFSTNLYYNNQDTNTTHGRRLISSRTRLYKGENYLLSQEPVTEMDYFADIVDVTQWTTDFLDLVALDIAVTLGPAYLNLEGKGVSKLGFKLDNLRKTIKYNSLYDSTNPEIADG